MIEHPPSRRLGLVKAAALIVAVGAVAWASATGWGGWATPDRLAEWGRPLAGSPGGVLVALAGFAVLATVVPLSVLVVAAALALPAFVAAPVALVGALLGSLGGYYAGRTLGRDAIERRAGERFRRIARGLRSHGVMPVALVRLAPIAPFVVVNVAAGALGVRLRDYLVGTGLALLPGIALATVFADRAVAAARDPSVETVVVLLLAAVAILGVGRLRARRAGGADAAGDPEAPIAPPTRQACRTARRRRGAVVAQRGPRPALGRRASAARRVGVAAAAATLAAAGCASVQRPTGELAVAEQSIRRAEETGAADDALLDLKRAREKLAKAQQVVDDEDEDRDERHTRARRLAEAARADAALADAKARAAGAERSADELRRTVDALRREATSGPYGTSTTGAERGVMP